MLLSLNSQFLTTKGPFGEFAGFYCWDVKKQAGRIRLFFSDQADLKRYSRVKNQSASIDASGYAGFFFVSEHPKKKIRRVGGKQADFEFIERPLNLRIIGCGSHLCLLPK